MSRSGLEVGKGEVDETARISEGCSLVPAKGTDQAANEQVPTLPILF